jgi:hypothetical protein
VSILYKRGLIGIGARAKKRVGRPGSDDALPKHP